MKNIFLQTWMILGGLSATICLLLGCANHKKSLEMYNTFKPSGMTSNSIAVVGKVQAPGYFAWTNGIHLRDAISSAGGLTEPVFASKLFLISKDGSSKTFPLREASIATNSVLLLPGDEVCVPVCTYW